MAAKNDITGDLIKTKGMLSKKGEDAFDQIFGKRDFRNRKIQQQLNEYPEDPDFWDESRVDQIGANGPSGLHYLNEEEDKND